MHKGITNNVEYGYIVEILSVIFEALKEVLGKLQKLNSRNAKTCIFVLRYHLGFRILGARDIPSAKKIFFALKISLRSVGKIC